METKKTLEVKVNISHEDIEDIIITALEGGSNYWYYLNTEDIEKIRRLYPKDSGLTLSEKIVNAVLCKNCIVRIHDVEEDEPDETEHIGLLSNDTIKRGIALAIQDGMCITDDSDTIFQLMILGEIFYS